MPVQTPSARIIAAVFLPFASGYFLSYLFRTINGPLADRIIAEFHLNAAMLGLLTSIYFLTFTLAQLPFGPLLDRFGPRRVQAIVLTIGACGAALFAAAENTATLIVARALIGLGTSGALMAGLKALTLWVPRERRALANGMFIMFGGLGAMSSTLPVDWLLPVVGWRGTFLVLAVAPLASVAAVLLAVPEAERTGEPEHWRQNVSGLSEIYRSPVFWQVAPLSGCVVGTAFAVHGLWAARWLTDVEGLSPERLVATLLVMGAGLTLGACVMGFLADFLRRMGVRSMTIFAWACLMFIGLQVAALGRVALPVWLIWGTIGSFGSMTVLSYSIIGELFPPEKISRANGALNVLHLGMAFVLQYGMGVVAAHWHADLYGHLPRNAYRAAFCLPLALETIALAWFLVSINATLPFRSKTRAVNS
jgi:MFS family permease